MGAEDVKFVETSPLFVVTTLPDGGFHVPQTISRDCNVCKKETTWRGGEFHLEHQTTYGLAYVCGLCQNNTFLVFAKYLGAKGKDYPRDFLYQKIGQFPAPSVVIPHSLAKHLGDSASFYRKALISYNQGYGIAAVAYLRRIVEDKTDELIDIVAGQAKERGLSDKEIEAILAAKKEQTYSDKLRVASEVIPPSLRPGGANPFGTLFGLLSDGLHGRSEEECLAIAEEIKEVFEYVFENLRTQIEDEKRFKDRMNKLASKQKT